MPEIPDSMKPALSIVGGACLLLLGLSFLWKAYQAGFSGKVRVWTGLENFGFLFVPITILTPLVTHLPSDEKKGLIQTRQGPWYSMIYAPGFILLALMFMTAGADQLGLPGSRTMNTVLTFGRTDVPPAITYSPPFRYNFPVMKKAGKRIFIFLNTRLYMDPKERASGVQEDTTDVQITADKLFGTDEELNMR